MIITVAAKAMDFFSELTRRLHWNFARLHLRMPTQTRSYQFQLSAGIKISIIYRYKMNWCSICINQLVEVRQRKPRESSCLVCVRASSARLTRKCNGLVWPRQMSLQNSFMQLTSRSDLIFNLSLSCKNVSILLALWWLTMQNWSNFQTQFLLFFLKNDDINLQVASNDPITHKRMLVFQRKRRISVAKLHHLCFYVRVVFRMRAMDSFLKLHLISSYCIALHRIGSQLAHRGPFVVCCKLKFHFISICWQD